MPTYGPIDSCVPEQGDKTIDAGPVRNDSTVVMEASVYSTTSVIVTLPECDARFSVPLSPSTVAVAYPSLSVQAATA